jgi:CheY-like chemotaxis protein
MERTILLVEDDQNDGLFLERGFAKARSKCPLQLVNDGRKAIDYLEDTGPFAHQEQNSPPYSPPDLVLLDLKLPFIAGLAVFKRHRGQPKLNSIIAQL